MLLLKLMLSKANFLLLDEPTNHLDIASREALESALQGYEGTLFVISHDRYLINKIADRVYYLEPGGAEEYQGNYDAFLEKRRQEEEPEKGVKPVPKQNDYKLRKQKESELRKPENPGEKGGGGNRRLRPGNRRAGRPATAIRRLPVTMRKRWS